MMYDIIMDGIADVYNVDREIVETDFARFSAEIDRVMAEEGLSEDEAIEKIWTYWIPPFDINNIDVDED